ncbi:MAG: sodium:proton antiporter [Clostridia bacterium]|nr:sodium:proton antiporter [Clostridia bacterium]
MLLLPLTILFPLVMAFVCFLTGRKSKKIRDVLVGITGVLTFVLCLFAWNKPLSFAAEGILGMGIELKADGFRSLYALIAAFMWMMTGLFSPEYFAHHHKRNRYYFFNLLTLSATLGVLFSDNLYTTFIFFEIMSLASYVWVAQEETPSALRAAGTYLAVAVIGGLATLMGLFMLYQQLGTLSFDGLQAAIAAYSGDLTVAVWLTVAGFAAKAGLFPLHIWLPKAHPVAPAPASALLSGMLTKTGVFGLIVVCSRLMPGNAAFGNTLLVLALVTMFLGALLALFSVDLKRTLACSSMSQIGFITVGLSVMVLLGKDGALAAYGTVMHMMNHSLIKLVLFISAGVVYKNLHQLNLNDIRGFGRKKPVLHIAFLLGALSLGCIPPLGSGYASKSLLHEALLEYIHHLHDHGVSALPYELAEVLFLISGGLTVAYMTKLYVCIFWEKHPTRQAEFDRMGSGMKPLSAIVLLASALILPVLGVLPDKLFTPLAERSSPFFGQGVFHHTIHYFSLENLKGAAWSIGIGMAVYFLIVRPLLMKKENGRRIYVNRWPDWLDLENSVYRPLLLDILPRVFHGVTAFIAHIPESFGVLKAVPGLITGFVRFIGELPEKAVLFLKNKVFTRHKKEAPLVGNRFTWVLGTGLNKVARFLNNTVLHHKKMRTDFEYVLDASWREIFQGTRRITSSLSFGLLLMCIGMFIICIYLLNR